MKKIGLILLMIMFVIALVSILVGAHHKDTQNYTLDSYTDTIQNNIILTTVANNGNNISISTIKIGEINND